MASKQYSQMNDEIQMSRMESTNRNNYTNDLLKEMKDRFLQRDVEEKERMIREIKEKDERLRQRRSRGKKEKDDGGYEEYKIPGDFSMGEDHLKAQRISKEYTEDELKQLGLKEKFCKCCGVQVERKQLTFRNNTEELGYLGSGYPLYFDFLKFSFGVLFMIFISSAIYNLMSNIMGSNCLTYEQIVQKYGKQMAAQHSFSKYLTQHHVCMANWITQMSYANKINNNKLIQLQSIMNFSTVIVVIIALQFFRKQQREVNVLCDEQNTTASDYGMALKYIPNDREGVDYDDEIMKKFRDLGLTLSSVNLAYNLEHYYKIKDSIMVIIAKKQNILTCIQKGKQAPYDKKQGAQTNEQLLAQVEIELQQEIDKENRMEEEFQSGVSKLFSGVSYVTFATEAERDKCVEQYELTSSWQKLKRYFKWLKKPADEQLVILDQPVVVEMAPEPTDVFWSNQGVSTMVKIKNRIISYIMDIIILIVLFTVVVLALDFQNSIKISKNPNRVQVHQEVKYLGYFISFLTVAVNYVLVMLMTMTTNYERWSTYTSYNVKLATKLTVVQFLNTAILQFVITYLFYKNYYGSGGLIYNQTLVFFTNTIVPSISLIIDIGYQKKRFLRWYSYRNKSTSVLTQKQVQELYENPDFPIAAFYAALLKTMFFCSFYAPIIPVGVILSMITVVVMYWITKYNLLYRTTVKNQQSSNLSLEMTELIEYVLIIYTFTNFVFEIVITRKFNIIALISVFLGIANAMAPMEEFNMWMFPPRSDADEVLNYYEAEPNLETDYGRANPATQELCMKAFINKYS